MTSTNAPNVANVVKVIGIDASTTNIGWAIVGYHREHLIASGVIALSGAGAFYDRLREGPRRLVRALKAAGIDGARIVVIEHSFFTNNPETGKKISMMIGACLCALLKDVPAAREVSPTEVKMCFAGGGKAQKKDVVEAVRRRYGLSVESEDEADAIAIASAFCKLHKQGHFEKKKAERAIRQKKVAEKRAITKAAKAGKNSIKGELPL